MKFFLIILLLTYVIYKVGAVLGRIIMVGRDITGESNEKKSPKGSNINIDYMPGGKGAGKKGDDFKGGEYVDYEEV